MTNIQAALGVAQLERLRVFRKKRWIGHRYNQLLKELPNIQLPLSETDFSKKYLLGLWFGFENSFKMDAKIF